MELITNDLLDIIKKNNILILDVKRNCTEKEFYDALKILDIDTSFFKKRMLINDIFAIKKEKIYFFEYNEIRYVISVSLDEIKISEAEFKANEERETFVIFNSGNYSISYLVRNNIGTISSYSYPNYGCDKDKTTKRITFNRLLNLLNNLSSYDLINDILPNFDDLFEVTNIIPDNLYFPVTSDKDISLSWKYKYNAIDINDENEATFDIVLNSTREIIGEISYDYFNNEGFSYTGNVSCKIKKAFRNKHYASKALSLLKNVLVNNNFKGDKDLYLSCKIDNYPSHKVIKNNGGELFYEGDVPYQIPINCIEGVKKIRVFRIKI